MKARFEELYARFVISVRIAARYVRRSFRGAVYYGRARKKNLPLRDRTVLFEAYRAVKIADNPYALFLAMLDDPYYRDFTFIWAIDDKASPYRKRFASDRRVRFVTFHSRAYAEALYTSKYVINNKAWPSYFSKRPEQVHVTTWHATAFKALGKEQGGTIGQFKNVTRNYLHADYLVMPNRFTSEVMLRSDDVKGIFPGLVLEEGYPRLDLTVNSDRSEVRRRLAEICGADPSKKIVLYAPTWRGETGGYEDTTELSIQHVKGLLAGLPGDYELLLKVHDLTYRHLSARKDTAGVKYVPDWFDTNELLAGVDILITDYSSIFFEFLVLDRPVIFFAYDLEEYTADRGLYFDMHAMPGPLCYTVADVVAAILDIEAVHARHADIYRAMLEEYCPGRDGLASKRACDIIFKGASSASAYPSFDAHKKRVLVTGCDFMKSRQTSEIINFSHNLDYDRFDLTVLFGGRITRESQRFLRLLDPRTRVFYGFGFRPFTLAEQQRFGEHRQLLPSTRCEPAEAERMRSYYETEKVRFAGATHFDVGMCFTDQLNDWTYLLAVCDFDTRIMWLPEASEDATVSMPAQFAASRFDHIVGTADVMASRFAKLAREAEAATGSSERSAVLREADRFEGFDCSIVSMINEAREQLEARLSAVKAHARTSHDVAALQQLDRLDALVTTKMQAIADRMSEQVVAVHERHGLDYDGHNHTVMDTFVELAG